jgi:hypothetical protein
MNLQIMNTKRISAILKSAGILLLCLFSFCSASAKSAVNAKTVLAKVQAVDTYIREVRGYLHEHPELSGQEYETAGFIQEERGKTVYVAMCWQNEKGQKGPWSEIESAIVP